MFPKIQLPVAVLSVAIALWMGSALLNDYLVRGYEREHGVKPASGSKQVSPEVQALRKEVDSSPDNLDLRLSLSRALVTDAERQQSSDILIEAISVLSEILARDPNYTEALYDMASISLSHGIIDKAVDYYERYLKLIPEDRKARNDYSIALIQRGEPEKAIPILQTLLQEEPHFAPQLTLALAFHVSGDNPSAKKAAEAAMLIAPNPEAKKQAENFLHSVEHPEHKAEDESSTSPAMVISKFFTEHEIIGPKLAGIQWTSTNSVAIDLNNFPIEGMPAPIREKFEANITSAFSKLTGEFKIELRDATTKQVLLSKTVGTKS